MLNFGLYRVLCVKLKETDSWRDTDVDGNNIKMDSKDVGCNIYDAG